MFGLAGLFSILAILLSLVAFVASIWLIAIAFRRSLMWGFATLLVPFAALVYAIKYWQEARKPFLLGVASGVASSILFFATAGIAAASMSREVARQAAADRSIDDRGFRSASTEGRPLSESDFPESPAEPITLRIAGDDPEPRAAAPPAAPSQKPIFDAGAVTRDGYAPVALRDAATLAGRNARIVTSGGRVLRGELVKADAGGVQLQRWLGGGTMVVEFRKGEIETLLVEVN